MIKNDEEKTSETRDSTRTTSMKSKISIAHLQSSYSRKQSKTFNCLNSTIIESIISLFDSSIFSSVALSHYLIEQTICEDDDEAIAIFFFSYVITIILSLFEQH